MQPFPLKADTPSSGGSASGQNHSDGISQISYQTSIALGHIIEATFWLIPVSLLDDLLEGWPHGENGVPFADPGTTF